MNIALPSESFFDEDQRANHYTLKVYAAGNIDEALSDFVEEGVQSFCSVSLLL
jgi:hypothetical protein